MLIHQIAMPAIFALMQLLPVQSSKPLDDLKRLRFEMPDISVERRGKKYQPADFSTVSENLGVLGTVYNLKNNVFISRRIAVVGALNLGQQVKDEDSNYYHNALINLRNDFEFWSYLEAMLGAAWDFERYVKEANKSGGTIIVRYRTSLDFRKLNQICKESSFVVTDNYCQVVVYGRAETAKIVTRNFLGQRIESQADLLTAEDIALLSNDGRRAALDLTVNAIGLVGAIRANARDAKSLFD